jgi:hypothetical protein
VSNAARSTPTNRQVRRHRCIEQTETFRQLLVRNTANPVSNRVRLDKLLLKRIETARLCKAQLRRQRVALKARENVGCGVPVIVNGRHYSVVDSAAGGASSSTSISMRHAICVAPSRSGVARVIARAFLASKVDGVDLRGAWRNVVAAYVAQAYV